uniref:Germin-like protein 9-3 n=2 Tax=Cajanus cajan TaxID=3821 RepID=A0A151RMY2_CAJCA|nr:Germin-like protein 9-3 [Cajanus cajan]
MFVFPKGLVHFQLNADAQKPAFAISAFGSANAGTVSIPSTLFNTSIDDKVLALAFKTDVATIRTLKKGFAPKA